MSDIEEIIFDEIFRQNVKFESVSEYKFKMNSAVVFFVEIYYEFVTKKKSQYHQKTRNIVKLRKTFSREKRIKNFCNVSTVIFNDKIIIELLKNKDRSLLEDSLQTTFKQHGKESFFNNDDFFRVWEVRWK